MRDGGRHAVDGRVAVLVAQAREDRDESERVGRGASEHAGVDLALERLDVHDDVRRAAQGDGQRREAELGVAGVLDEHRVGRERPGVCLDPPVEAARALLLGALDDEPDPDGEVVAAERAQGPQRGEVRDDVPLAVRGAAPVEATVALGELEGRAGPRGVVEGRLDVVVRVEQDGGRAVGPGTVAQDDLRPVGRDLQARVDPLRAERVGHPARGALALGAGVEALVGDGRDGDERAQVVERARQEALHGGPHLLDVPGGVGSCSGARLAHASSSVVVPVVASVPSPPCSVVRPGSRSSESTYASNAASCSGQ